MKIQRKLTARYKVQQALYNYREIRQKISIIKDNIKYLTEELENVFNGKESMIIQDIFRYDLTKVIEKINYSVVEKEVFRIENNKNASSEYIKELIDKENLNLNYYKDIINIIDKALKTLTNRQYYIINMWYIDSTHYSHKNILDNYNKKFKTQITSTDTIKQMKCESLDKLEKQLSKSHRIMSNF